MDRLRPFVLAVFFAGSALFAPAQTLASHKIALPGGIQVSANGTILQITALRDDVLRVRASHDAALPEDASWAVLPAAREASVSVIPEANGFETKTLRVVVSPDLRITVSDLDGNVIQQDAAPIWWQGHAFTIAKQDHIDSHFFGLGDKTGPLDRAGEAFTLWNTDAFGWQESTDPLYKAIPWFIEDRGGRAFGMLLDNTFRTFFDFGRQDPHQYTISASDGPVDYYLVYGPDPKHVVETYAWLTGPTPLPPLWTLGFQQSRYSYYPESRVREIAHRLRADHIPADAIYLDIDYQDHYRPFTVDRQRFPHFEQMISDLAKDHFHTVLIVDLHIANYPGHNYYPYDSGIAGDHFVKNPDGSIYTGVVWPGPAVFPDFTQQSTRKWFGTLYKNFVNDGVAGFWDDMNEPSVFNVPTKTMPDDVEHRIDEPGFKPRTATHLEIHNVYGMENSRATHDGLLTLRPNERPFVLTRASYAGGQRYAATWTGDNSSTWNHLRLCVPQIVNLGLSGFGMTGADVGGFAGTPQNDLLTKWIEVAAFQPIDRDHTAIGTGDQEPWVGGPAAEAIRRHFIDERYKLMPYLYTTAEEMSRTGLPINRPLFLEFPHATKDGHPLDLDAPGEFLVGPDVLVAPPPYFDELDKYLLALPSGPWYDYWTGQRVDSRKHIMIQPELAKLPVYVRGGSIIPIAPLRQSTEEKPVGPLTLRVYPGHGCRGDIYQDDGNTFNYLKGEFFRQHFTCDLTANGQLKVHMDAPEGTFKPWWTEVRIEAYGLPKPSSKTIQASAKAIDIILN